MTDKDRYLAEIQFGLLMVAQRYGDDKDLSFMAADLLGRFYDCERSFEEIPEDKTIHQAASEAILGVIADDYPDWMIARRG